jgi:hypothetical protein
MAKKPDQRRRLHKPPLTVEQVLAWAKAHFDRTGRWPHAQSGAIHEAPVVRWSAINKALEYGSRGFPGGSSLSKLLNEHMGSGRRDSKPPLTLEQVLAWMNAHHRRTGQWPYCKSGTVQDAPGEYWMGIARALRYGGRGLPAGLSLRLLRKQQGWK